MDNQMDNQMDITQGPEEFAMLANALGMPMEGYEEVFKKCEPVTKYTNIDPDPAYPTVLEDMSSAVRSMDIANMDPRQAFCCGAMLGIVYRIYMDKEIDRRVAVSFDNVKKDTPEV